MLPSSKSSKWKGASVRSPLDITLVPLSAGRARSNCADEARRCSDARLFAEGRCSSGFCPCIKDDVVLLASTGCRGLLPEKGPKPPPPLRVCGHAGPGLSGECGRINDGAPVDGRDPVLLPLAGFTDKRPGGTGGGGGGGGVGRLDEGVVAGARCVGVPAALSPSLVVATAGEMRARWGDVDSAAAVVGEFATMKLRERVSDSAWRDTGDFASGPAVVREMAGIAMLALKAEAGPDGTAQLASTSDVAEPLCEEAAEETGGTSGDCGAASSPLHGRTCDVVVIVTATAAAASVVVVSETLRRRCC